MPGPMADDRPPLGESRAQFRVLRKPLPQAVQPLGDALSGCACQLLRPRVHLDARHHPRIRQDLHNRRTVVALLTDGLVVQNNSADELGSARRPKQHLPVVATVRLGALSADAVEPALNSPGALVGCQDALTRRHQRPGGIRQCPDTCGLRHFFFFPLKVCCPSAEKHPSILPTFVSDDGMRSPSPSPQRCRS